MLAFVWEDGEDDFPSYPMSPILELTRHGHQLQAEAISGVNGLPGQVWW